MNCTVRYARRRGGSEPGMALVIVMILVLALAVIAGVFSHKIQVEAKLTANTRAESDLEWLGRSGVEVARWVLATEKRAGPTAQVDSFRDFWAGGPGVTNAMDFPFEGVSLDRIELGAGWCSVRIIDQERKININSLANRNVPPAQGMRIMEHALNFVGAEGMESSKIITAISDWVRPPLPGGARRTEAEDYSNMDPPYIAKNGPIEDITELLKIRGITPEMFWGAGKSSDDPDAGDGNGRGLVDLFCALSSNTVNVNTASAEVLSVVFGVDPQVIEETLIRRRAGEDGQEGTEDDMPILNPAEATAMVGVPGPGAGAGGVPGGVVPGGGAPGGPGAGGPPGMARLGVRSTIFEVRVEAHLAGSSGRFVAMVARGQGAREPQILYFRRD